MTPAQERICLQLALDHGKTPELMEIARRAAPHVDWVEAGTPWILAEGLAVVRLLRAAFPERRVVADLKIADAGELEAEMAFAAGADLVTVLGVAGDSTLAAALRAARRYEREIAVDLLHVPDPAARARDALGLGARLAIYHLSHDDPGAGPGRLPDAARQAQGRLVVAGGVRLEDVPRLVALRPRAIVVGRAITEAPDPLAAARAFREALDRESGR